MTESATAPRAIVVLGSHRSGTSLATRGLECLGVELGADLLPASRAENPRGFYEDVPLLEISERVLDALGLRWDSPSLLDPEIWQRTDLDNLELEAADSIRSRFGELPIWGFKNPRTARLLPFWQRVLSRIGREDAYVVVVRNPHSVARSLEVRNGFPPVKSYLLWLLHVTEAVIHTRSRRRVCVDYDQLLADPANELARVSRGLGLADPGSDPKALKAFVGDFLEPDHRHSHFEASDMELDADVSGLAQRAFSLVHRWARDDDPPSEAQLRRGFAQISKGLQELAPVFRYVTTLDAQLMQAGTEVEEWQSLSAERARELDVRTDELGAARTRLATLNEELAGTQSGFEEAQAQLDATRVALEGAEAELGVTRTEIDAARTELSSTRAALETATAELGNATTELGIATAGLEQTRGELGGARAELAHRETRLQETEAELGGVRMELAAADAELGATRNELEARQLDVTSLEEEVRRQAAERAEIAAAHHQEQQRSLEEKRNELRVRDAELTALREQADEHLRGAEAAAHESDVLQIRLREANQAVEQLRASITAQQDEAIEWLHGQTAAAAAQLVAACQGLRASRTWKQTAWIQRMAVRARRGKWVDGTAHLQHLVDELNVQAQRRYTDVRFLAAIAGDVRDVLSQILGGRIFRVVRQIAGLRHFLLLRSRPSGPVELLRNRAGELSFFLHHLSDAPIESATAPPPSALPAVGGCVDVVIPVHNAREESLRCIDSVLCAENRTPHEVIVIDDASHDRKLRRALDELARSGSISLLRNDENLGFPRTVNRGMALHVDRDVVILNSDTLVHGDWLDRLRRSAHSDWNVATVTPFTNNGEICSYPAICQSQPIPDREELARLDEMAAARNAGLSVTLPTAVGFCTYIRRSVLNEIGYFDAERFQRGYGEENEFCLRARANGYRNLLAADVFVGHEGGSSFLEAKEALIAQGLERLAEIHPGYEAEIHRFIGADPVRRLRRRLDIALLADDGRSAVLIVTHAMGGGTDRHVLELAAHLEREQTPVFLLRPESPSHVSLTRYGRSGVRNLSFDLRQDFSGLLEALRLIPIGHIHIHHLIGFDPIVRELSRQLPVPYDVTIHDYFSICPRVHLVDDRESYCGVPDAQACTDCIRRNGGVTGFDVDMERWRSENETLLANARRVFVPSQDVRDRLDPMMANVEWRVRPHADEVGHGRSVVAKRRKGKPLRVAVIGAIGPHKGAAALLECAIDASKRDLPIEFHVVGYTDRDEALLATSKVSITGPYEEEDLHSHLARARCHLAWLPSVWPETFCYTLTGALRGHLYPVAFDLGAVAERIRELGWGELLSIRTSASDLNDRLLAVEPKPFPASVSDGDPSNRYTNYLVDYYDDLVL